MTTTQRVTLIVAATLSAAVLDVSAVRAQTPAPDQPAAPAPAAAQTMARPGDPAVARGLSLLRGRRLMERGAAAEAEPIFAAVLVEADAAGDQVSAARAERGLARARGMQGDDAAAERWFTAAEDRATRHTLPAELAATRVLRGNAAYAKGDHRAAAALWRAALAAAEAADVADVMVQALGGLAFVSTLDDARVFLERGLGVARGNPALAAEEGRLLHALSDNAYLRGEWARAMQYLEGAQPLVARLGSPVERVRLRLSLARLFKSHGQHDRALAEYRGAAADLPSVGVVIGLSTAWATAASGLMLVGHPVEAEGPAARAVAVAQAATNQVDEVVARTVQAEVLNALGRPAEALAVVEQAPLNTSQRILVVQRADALSRLGRHAEALAAARAAEVLPGGTFEALPTDLARIAEVQRRAGAVDDALRNARRAVDTLERLRTEAVPFDQFKVGFDDGFQRVHAALIRALSASGRHEDALEASERARARAFADLLATRGIEQEPGGPQIAAAQPATLEAIRLEAARTGTVVAAYWTDADQSEVWTVSPKGAVAHTVIPVTRRELDDLVARTRRLDEPTGAQPRSRSAYRRLYDLLFQPVVTVARQAATNRITVVPHGPIFTLSFAGLQAPDGRFVVERFALHYVPSVASLAALPSRDGGGSPTPLVVMAPAVEARADAPLPPLPGAAAEGRAVGRALDAAPTRLLGGRDATETAVREAATRARLLHFATHAMVFDDRPMDSYLALASGDPANGAAADGRLTAEEIYGLRLQADLVVLSACRSGAGRVTGDGVVGLARAFFGAGASSVVASLWDLPDVIGPQLLPRFYREIRQGSDTVTALRTAQLGLLVDLRAGRVVADTEAGPIPVPVHPAIWAGVVLLGRP